VPDIKHNKINVSLDAYHQDYYGFSQSVQLSLSNESEKNETHTQTKKGLLTLLVEAYPQSLAPGETTIIFFRVFGDNKIILSNLSFNVMDNNAYGEFSPIELYNDEFFTFKYTVFNLTNVSNVTIILLASHENYFDSIAIIQLNITNNAKNLENETSQEVESIIIDMKFKKLSINITPYPNQISPGEKSVFMIYITSMNMPITSAKIKVFDNGVAGNISDLVEYGGGHYSFVYTLPQGISKSINIIPIILIVSHENYSDTFNIFELSIKHDQNNNKEMEENFISIDIRLKANQVLSGETTLIEVVLAQMTSILPLSDIEIELTDNGMGGDFWLLNKYDDGKFVYMYIVPTTTEPFIEITARAIYYDHELCRNNTNIEIIQNQLNEKESQEKTSENTTLLGYFLIIFLILIVGIMIGIFSFSAYLFYYKNKPNKSKSPAEKIKNNSKQNNTMQNKITETKSNPKESEIGKVCD
jgi:hypothetical protein